MFLILFVINKSELDKTLLSSTLKTLLVDVIMSISLDLKCEIFSTQVLQIDSENLMSDLYRQEKDSNLVNELSVWLSSSSSTQ